MFIYPSTPVEGFFIGMPYLSWLIECGMLQ